MTEEQKVVELLKPRWKVIAEYPQSIFPIGAVFYIDKLYAYIKSPNGALSTQSNYYVQNPGKYPDVFKSLAWWEERGIDAQMPTYVKIDWGGGSWKDKVGKAEFSKNNTNVTVWFNEVDNHLFHRSDVIPCTQKDFDTFINQTTKI